VEQRHYVGLDVSLDLTSICVVDEAGAIVWRGKCASEPDAIGHAIRAHAPAAVRIGLETGQLSNWLTRSLRQRDLPIVCLDARHAKAALSLQINKSDSNDAFGLAQVVRTGWFREVAVKSMDAQTLRMLLVARAQLVSQRQTLANTIRGLLKTFGHAVQRGKGGPFAVRVRALVADNAALSAIIEPLLTTWQTSREQIGILDRQLLSRAKADHAAKRLMSIPSVGVIVALAYIAVIDTPTRFKRSRSVATDRACRRMQRGSARRGAQWRRCASSQRPPTALASSLVT
jgi:transposase